MRITLPLSLGALAVWLALTLGGSWLDSGGVQQSLADEVGSKIGIAWVLAALFALAVALASNDRRAAGICLPTPARSLWLVWLPLLYTILMLLFAWISGLPPLGMILIALCNTVLVGLSEELMFRSVLLQGFLTKYSMWPAILMSSVIFGSVHAVNGFTTGDFSSALWQSASAFLQGVGYAAIRVRTRSVWPMVVVHGLWDFSLMITMLSPSSSRDQSTTPYAGLLAVLPVFLYGLYLLRGTRGHAMLTPATKGT
jgi:membrane protease YdiL (CAAX protease family)